MTNPGNAVGTNGAYGGRTSVNANNDLAAAFSGRGILSGWKCLPKAGLTVSLGGDGINRDVAIAEDDIGNKTTVNNISEQPIDLTLSESPSIGQRIDVIVAYVNNPPEGSVDQIDNPEACGLIIVEGEVVANNPVTPTEAEIRTAIGADGGNSVQAYYVIMATISVTEGMTDVVADNITAGATIGVGATDQELNPLSDNPVANKVLTQKFAEIDAEIGDVDALLTTLSAGNGVTITAE